MQNKFKLAIIMDSDEVTVSKYPILLGILLTYLAALFVQDSYKLSFLAAIGFTIVMLIHALVFWFSDVIFKHRHWLYFLIQGIIVFFCAIIMPRGYETIFLGLIPMLIFQTMVVYYELLKVVIVSLFFYIIFCGTIIVFEGVKELIRYIPTLIIMTIAVRAYSAIFLKQVKLRIQTQKMLRELELAYEKVEELTLINERQRMARDLHDTLSQGLAGLIMQLEAVNANLNKNNTKRAVEIVEKSMEHARKTLSDARLVIHDLRFQENTQMDFVGAVEGEIASFKAVSNTSISTDIRIESQISPKILKHILYIVREALNNIAKHAEAKNAVIEMREDNSQLNVNIYDDGIGFDVKILERSFGHYGILGMTERVKAIDGKIKIKSERKSGTYITIVIPIEKGIYDGNG